MCSPLALRAPRRPASDGDVRDEASPVARPSRRVLLRISGPEGRHTFLLCAEEITIGRSLENDVAIGAVEVDPVHVVIRTLDDGVVVTAGGPTGFVVDGEPCLGAAVVGWNTPVGLVDDISFAVELHEG